MRGIQEFKPTVLTKPQPGEIWLDRFGVRLEIISCGNKYAVVKAPGTDGRENTPIHLLTITKEPPFVAPTPVGSSESVKAKSSRRPTAEALDREFLGTE